MTKYTKRNQGYWLKKNRVSKDKAFSRKRKVDKKRIVQKILKETMFLAFGISLFFLFLGFYYNFSIFFIIGTIFLILGILLKIYFYNRSKTLNTYKRISNLQKMNPRDFEEYITNLFNKLGFKVKTTVGVGDKGADSIGKDNLGKKIIIQTKRYSDKNTVGSPDIRNFAGSMSYYKVKKGIFVTTGYFTKEAINDIKKLNGDLEIILIDKDKLTELIEKAYKI